MRTCLWNMEDGGKCGEPVNYSYEYEVENIEGAKKTDFPKKRKYDAFCAKHQPLADAEDAND